MGLAASTVTPSYWGCGRDEAQARARSTPSAAINGRRHRPRQWPSTPLTSVASDYFGVSVATPAATSGRRRLLHLGPPTPFPRDRIAGHVRSGGQVDRTDGPVQIRHLRGGAATPCDCRRRNLIGIRSSLPHTDGGPRGQDGKATASAPRRATNSAAPGDPAPLPLRRHHRDRSVSARSDGGATYGQVAKLTAGDAVRATRIPWTSTRHTIVVPSSGISSFPVQADGPRTLHGCQGIVGDALRRGRCCG